MKKIMTRFISMAAAALMGTIITACSSSDDTIADTPKQPENTGKVVTLKTTVGFDDGSAATRALTAGGVKTFAAGDQIALIYTQNGGATAKAVSAALPEGTYGKSAEFTFELTNPKTSEPVTYIYPAAMAKADGTENFEALYTQQDGTLETLGKNYDLATYTHAWDGNNLPGATLENQLAILAINLKDAAIADGNTSNITSTITGLTISDGMNTYAVNRSAAAGPIYVAIHPIASTATIKVSATDGTKNYVKTLMGKPYEKSNGYNVSWLMTNATPLSETTPLTVEALTKGSIVVNKPRENMQYSVNGGTKISISSTENPQTITVEAGDKVEFYGNGTSITRYGVASGIYTTIAGGTADVKVYGNIMSLVDEAGFATATTLPAENTFSNLFSSNTALTDASGLLLPAPTMTQSCYEGMFHSCSSLTAAPALPATTLAQSCYCAMFWECTNLKTAPALPAKTLAEACYMSMFWECTSLTAAPAELPATELAFGCYTSMFKGCSSLETAPVLPAMTLAENCYTGMFSGCKKLSAVTCLATDIDYPEDYTSGWLDDVAPSGTFTKNPSMTGWPTNDEDINYGIPSGWTVVDYVAP